MSVTETDASALPLIDAEAETVASPPPTPVHGSAGRLLLGVSIVLISVNLRAAVTSVGPVLHEIIRDAGLSAAAVSVLTTLPSLCFGLAAPLAPQLARRTGTERAVLAGLLLMAAGIALRGLGGAPALYAGQVLAMAGIGLINVLLPGLVKRDFPDRVALMTGLYTMAFCTGAAGAAGATVPLAVAFGGSWAAALAIWAVPAALAAAVWAWQLPPREPVSHGAMRVRGLWSDPLAWQVMLFMGLQSALAYIVLSWLPPILRDRGLSQVEAGLVLSVSVVMQAGACLFAPALATRGKNQSFANVFSVALCMAGLLGCFFAPLGTVWIWAAVLGISQGALISIALTVIVLRSPDARVAAHLSGMAQAGGYILASAGPMLTGMLRAWTGSWTSVAVFCMGLGSAAAVCGWLAGRSRHVRPRIEA
jgi:MFS transporter, CP family, cyanate transporter